MRDIKITPELRIARAAARAEAAAEKAEKILAILEAKIEHLETAEGKQTETLIRSERLEASEEAIVELAMMVAGMEG